TLTEYTPREAAQGIPDDVWLQVLRKYGAPDYAGAVRSIIQLQYQADKGLLDGTRQALSVTYGGTTHQVSKVAVDPEKVQVTRGPDLPDLEVTEFTSIDERYSETAKEKVWTIRAVIRNSGKQQVPQRFRVRLEAGYAKSGQRASQFAAIGGPNPWI